MTEYRTNLNGLSVGMLKKIISDISDDCEITVFGTGDTGFVDKCELEIVRYESFESDVYINVKAESGYY